MNLPMRINPKKINSEENLASQFPELDLSVEHQFIKLLPAFLAEAVAKLPLENFEMSEEELRNFVFGGEGIIKGQVKPDSVSTRLRGAIWDEYDRCLKYNERVLQISRVVKGIMSLPYFVNRYITDPRRLTWLMYPPADYKKALNEVLDMGLSQFLEIMGMPNTCFDRWGNEKINTKLLEVKLKIFEHVDMRMKGAIIQRIDQRTLNVNVDADAESAGLGSGVRVEPEKLLTVDEIDERIEELESRSERLGSPAQLQPDIMKPELGYTSEYDYNRIKR